MQGLTLNDSCKGKANEPNNQINRGNNTDVCWLDFQSYNESNKRGKQIIAVGTPVLYHITILVIKTYLPGIKYIQF